jgi:hypothetical protein
LSVGLDLAFDSFIVMLGVEVILWVETFVFGFLFISFEFGAFNKVLIDTVVIAKIGFETAGLFGGEFVVG